MFSQEFAERRHGRGHVQELDLVIANIRKQKTTGLNHRRERFQVRQRVVKVLEDFAHNQYIAQGKSWDRLRRRAVAKGYWQF